MNELKIALGLEFEDDYKKAKQDLLQAIKSIQKLSPKQQQQLAEEILGAELLQSYCQFCKLKR